MRKDMLGYDRLWSRYWLLEGSCPEAVTSDDSPASCWVYVERCHSPPGEKRHHRKSPHDEEEDLPLGQLAQQAQHDEEAPQRAKRRKVRIPDDQGEATSWGCYKSAERVSQLIDYLNPRGKLLTHILNSCIDSCCVGPCGLWAAVLIRKC